MQSRFFHRSRRPRLSTPYIGALVFLLFLPTPQKPPPDPLAGTPEQPETVDDSGFKRNYDRDFEQGWHTVALQRDETPDDAEKTIRQREEVGDRCRLAVFPRWHLAKKITSRCCCCCFSHSAHWLPTRKKLLYTVANPARGLLDREKKKKSGSAPPRALLVRRKK